jgi:hypothetical protein
VIQYLVAELIIALRLLKLAVRLVVSAIDCVVNMVNITLLISPGELNAMNTAISLTRWYCTISDFEQVFLFYRKETEKWSGK